MTSHALAQATEVSHFSLRESCPVCAAQPAGCLIDLPYDSGPVHDHLSKYYGQKGCFEPEYVAGVRYRVMECGGCGLIYQEAVPNAALLARVYGLWIDPVAAEARWRRGQKLDQYLAEQWLLRGWRPGESLRVLDYGMGHGRWCEVAALFGHEVHGFEFDRYRRDAMSNGGPVAVVAYDDIENGRYDFINTEQVFEHLAEPLATLRHLVAGLASGGIIRLSVPNGRLVKQRLAAGQAIVFAKRHPQGVNPIEPLQHLNCFTHKSLEHLAATCGLSRYRFPVGAMIAARQDWSIPTGFVRNILRPVYARLRYDDGTSLYFRKS